MNESMATPADGFSTSKHLSLVAADARRRSGNPSPYVGGYDFPEFKAQTFGWEPAQIQKTIRA